MSRVEFIYYGIPTGKGRTRVSTRGGFARAYTPKKTKEAEQNLQAQAAQYRPEKLMEGPINFTLKIYFPIPQSWSQKKQIKAENKEIIPETKPDADNILKLTSDAFNGIIWHDDKQVSEVHLYRYYSNTPRIEFEIQEI